MNEHGRPKILFLNEHMHSKNLGALREYTALDLDIINHLDELSSIDCSRYDYIYSPAILLTDYVKKYPAIKFIFGPHVSVFPTTAIADIVTAATENLMYIQPGEWASSAWRTSPHCRGLRIETVPFGVDTVKFAPVSSLTPASAVFIYFKRRDPLELDVVCQFLTSRNVFFHLLNYTQHYDEKDYLNVLHEAKYGIWLGSHESQGFALQEALSCNVPLLVWNVRSMNQEYGSNLPDVPATSIPYWDERCGEQFTVRQELIDTYDRFMANLNTEGKYQPREFVLENLSMTVCQSRFLSAIKPQCPEDLRSSDGNPFPGDTEDGAGLHRQPVRSAMYSVFLADTFSADEAGLFGRAMANRRLLTAIITCEEIEAVYTTSPCSTFSPLELPGKARNKIIQLTSLAEVDATFAGNRIHAVFCSDFIANFADWIHYRNAHGLNTSVFGFTHSLSYQRFTAAIYQILCSRPSGVDGILCTSLCAEDVLGSLFEQVQSTMKTPPPPPPLLRFPLPIQWDTLPEAVVKDSDPFQVLFVGRLDWQTKADLLTLKNIIPKLPVQLNIRFIIAGSADNEAYLMLLRRELEPLGVTLKLSVSEEEKHRLYQSSHLLFSPSDNYQETFGLTVIEAMGYGCVPVVTDFDGYRDLVREKIGFRLKTVAARIPRQLFAAQGVVSEGTYHGWWSAGVSFDPLEAVRRIEQLARDRSLWERMSSAARESVADYSLARTSERLGSLLRQQNTISGSNPQPTDGENPFLWDFTKLFSTHPTELWGGTASGADGGGDRIPRRSGGSPPIHPPLPQSGNGRSP